MMRFTEAQVFQDPGNNQHNARKGKGKSWINFIDSLSFLLFLFFIQQITFLVESIYMLNLLNTQMDIRAMGILFLALPGLFYFINQNKTNYVVIVRAMLMCMLLSPLLPSSLRIFSSGLGAGLFLLYFSLQLTDGGIPKINWGQSAALATLTSILFRIAGKSLDISVTGNTKIIGWILLLFAAVLFYGFISDYPDKGRSTSEKKQESSKMELWLSTLGLAGAILFIYFAFSSPGVISRWTGSNYPAIHSILLVSIVIIVFFGYQKLISFSGLRSILAVWNVIFLFFFIWNILLHRVSFPSLVDLTPVIVHDGNANNFNLVTYIMLVLSPVIFINVSFFVQRISPSKSKAIVLPVLGAVLLMILCIFVLIFTNTWGYVGGVSHSLRNQFHIPFAIAGLAMVFPYFFVQRNIPDFVTLRNSPRFNTIISLLLAVSCLTLVYAVKGKPVYIDPKQINQLTLMTYNIQQGVDYWGNKNFEGQLNRIRDINPDILCLQECDASRISGGNSDVVRYFAVHLGYYSYYGPKTITGTYGTAILSRFPMDSCRSVFTYSTKDEIGTAVSEISVDNRKMTIINSHPAGNETSRQEHINMVESLTNDEEMVIAMGDYNFSQDSRYYRQITNFLKDAWIELYPHAIGPVDVKKLDSSFHDRKNSSGWLLGGGKIDMTNRIDHIFLSRNFKVLEAHYLPAPESETDHPLHWAVVSWD